MTEKLLHIKDRLNLKSGNLCQAYQIKCKKYDKFKDLFLVIGPSKLFIAVIASRFKDAGLGDVLIQSNIVAEGSVDTIWSGSCAYKRAIRIYKITFESFPRILFADFELTCTSECNGILQLLDDIDESYDFSELLESNGLREFCKSLITYENNLAEKGALSKFWLSFLEMIEVMLNFIYVTRSGKWNLQIETIRSAFPII